MSIEHKDQNEIENGYFDKVNHDLLARIPATASAILEVGCGAGALASEYRKINPSCRYFGIELSQKAANFAMKYSRLDMVLVGDVDAVQLPDLGIEPESLDCIIYGDVLEHLADPWNTLRSQIRFLKPGGTVIASIPNISNFSIIYQLLKGNWNYAEEGLLDRTHIRFFTFNSVVALFKDAGLVPVAVDGSVYNAEAHATFMNCMKPAIEAFQLKFEEVAQETSVFQYLVVAQKPE